MNNRTLLGVVRKRSRSGCFTCRNFSFKKVSEGFTVIELLIAVGIIVVIMAIIFFLVSNSRAKAVDARTQETLSNIRTVAVEENLHSNDSSYGESGGGSEGGTGGTGYANVCSSASVRERVYQLAAQLETVDYACVSSSNEFVVAFPLKADEGYWCVDAEGASVQVPNLPTSTPPHTCGSVLAAADGGGTGGSGTGDTGGSGSGSGGSEGGTGGDSGGGSGGEGSGGDGSGDGLGDEEEQGPNHAPVITLGSGSLSIGGATQTCSGAYCVVVPENAEADQLAFVGATDAEDGTIEVEILDVRSVYTSDVPTNGPGVGQKTIQGIGVFEGCNVSSQEITYEITDSDGVTRTAKRTILACSGEVNPDTTPPTTAITTPSSSAQLSGETGVVATASDDVGVVGVTFKYGPTVETATTVIGEEDTTASGGAYSTVWNTTVVENGTYVLIATARDISGNTASSAPVSITVSNAPEEPPGPAARKPLLFSSGFEGTTATYLSGFSNSQHCCSYSITQSTTVHREGLASLRAEVRNNDQTVSGGKRAEVEPIGPEDTGDRWYGWSAYFESPTLNGIWDPTYGGTYISWNREDHIGSGPLGMQGEEGGYLNIVTADSQGGVYYYYGPSPGSAKISITTNTWHDFVIHANWNTGLLEAWVDGSLLYSTPAGSGVLENPGQYLKIGIARWGSGPGGAPTGGKWVVYYDNFRMGDGATGVSYYDVAPGDY